MVKIKRFSSTQENIKVEDSKLEEKTFTSTSGKKYKLPDMNKFYKESYREYKETFDFLAK